jgi:uncharacterized membrane protein
MTPRLDRATFALALIGLGILTFVFGDFALQWQPVPAWMPARTLLAYLSGVIMLATGFGLLFTRTEVLASRVLVVYLALWFLLKVPALFTGPLVEVNWLGAGELAVVFAAGWVLFASTSNAARGRGSRLVRFLFGFALIPIGLSHFFYLQATIGFVPKWLPFPVFWAYLGGAGHIAAGLAVLFGVVPRLAATLEGAMIGVFTLLVWLPGVLAAQTNRLQWTGMFMSWIIGAAAWVVAGDFAPRGATPAAGDFVAKAPAGLTIGATKSTVKQS